MRDSGFAVWLYIGMVGVPVLMLAYLVSSLLMPEAASVSALRLLIAIGLLVLSIVGMEETFFHKRESRKGMSLKTEVAEKAVREDTSMVHGQGVTVTVKVKRFNPETKSFDVVPYRIKADRLKTVLGALIDIKSYADPTLSIRYSCRMGICGSCGMVVNGKPVLACEQNLMNNLDGDTVTVEPMQGHPLLKDLVTDFDEFFAKHSSVKPYLYRKNSKEMYSEAQLYKQTDEQTYKFLPYSSCIMCGLCLDACPVVNTNPSFVGPQALSQAYRYHADSRDQAGPKRLFNVDSLDGVWGCEFAGSCSKACPKGVDPATAIQMLKAGSFQNMLNKEDENDAL